MGILADSRRQRRQARTSSPFIQSQPGDPLFSPSQVTESSQYPAAAAEYRFYENQRNASNRIAESAQLGYSPEGPDFERLQEGAGTGFLPRALTFGERLIGWIDGPRQAVNLLMQDIITPNDSQEFEDPGFGDYWNAFWGGVEDRDEFRQRTGLDPVSGSKTLDMFGWEEEEDFWPRVGRGVADFGLQVLTDPLTYVTGGLSGLGRKVGIAAGKRVQRDAVDLIVPMFKSGKSGREIAALLPEGSYFRKVAASLEDDIGRMQDDFVRYQSEFDGAFPAEMQDAMSRWLTRGSEGDILAKNAKSHAPLVTPDTFWENIAELSIARRVGDDVIKPLARRDFGALPAEVLEELPAYARGGLRIAVPFTKRSLESGLVIPGTRGLGHSLIGEPMQKLSQRLRSFGPYAKLADSLDSAVDSFDTFRALNKAIGTSVDKGGIESWQYWIAAPVLDHIHNTGARRVILRNMNAQLENLTSMAKENGIDDMTVIYSHMMDALQKAEPGHEMVDEMFGKLGLTRQTAPSSLVPNKKFSQAIDDLTEYISATFEEYHSKLAVLDPSVKEKWVDGMVPHVKTDHGHDVLNLFGGKAIGISKADIEADPGMALLARLLKAQHQGGKLETRLGATRWFDEQIGRVNAFTLADGGPFMLDENMLEELSNVAIKNGIVDPDFLETRFLPVSTLNEMLEPAIKRLADERGIILPSSWDGKLFNENPLEILSEYLASMEEAIAVWGLIDGLKTSGLAFRSQKSLNIQDTVQAMFDQTVRRTTKVKSTQFGKPQNEDVPIGVLSKIVDETDIEESLTKQRGQVTVNIDDLGRPRVISGFTTLKEAREQGIESLPVKWTRDSDFSTYRHAPGSSWNNYLSDSHSPTYSAMAEKIDDIAMSDPELEERLVKDAINTWQGSGRRLRSIIEHFANNPNAKVPDALNDDTLEAIALMRAHARDAKPWKDIIPSDPDEAARWIMENYDLDIPLQRPPKPDDLVSRVGRMGIGEEVKRAEEGTKLTLFMESAGVGDHPFYKGNQKAVEQAASFPAPRSKEGAKVTGATWAYMFSGDTPVLPNFNNLYEREVLVSGEFTVVSVDDLSKEIWLAYDGPAFAAAADPAGFERVIKQQRELSAKDLFKQLPWGPNPIQENHILKGFEKVSSRAIPVRVMGDLTALGLPNSKDTVHLNKQLFEMAKMSKDDFMSIRMPNAARYTPLDIPEGQKWAMEAITDEASGLVDSIRLSIREGSEGDLAIMQRLDTLFRENGGFTPKNVQRVLQSADTDDAAADAIHKYVQSKMASATDNVKEFFSGEAAEVFDTRMYYDAWEEGMNDFIKAYAFPMTAGGQLIVDPSKLRQAGDQPILDKLAEIKTAARNASDAGYDELAKIMRNVEVWNSMSQHEYFVDPAKYALGGPAVADLQIHDAMGKFLRNFAGNAALMYTPQGIAAAKVATNNTLRWWRGMATIARPSFHTRNLVGGSWMNMLMGVSNKSNRMVAVNARRFRQALAKPRKAGVDIIEEALKELPADARPYFRAIWDEDILNGFVSTEFRRLTPVEKRGRLNALNVFDTDGFFMTRAGGHVMESIEDFLRASLFVEYFDPASPASAKVAREMVNAVHFDYVNLTPMETKIKSFVPFFVWTRRNLPRQIQMAVENPRTIQRYRAMMQSMNDNFGGNDDTLPQGDHFSAFAAGTDYYVNENTPFWTRMMIDPDLPVRDLLELPMPTGPEALDWANGLLGPHISTLFDINEQREWGDVSAPAQFVPILKGLAALGLYDESPGGEVRIPYLLRTLAETAVPFSRELVDPLTGGPSDPNRQQRVGVHPEDDPLTAALKNMAAIGAGGFGVKGTTPADARGAAARSRDELDSIISKMRFGGELAPSQRR